ncbi:MAG: thiol-disulfide oxidoreductase DCC family protein [Ginsengibacter sp.]
MQSDRIILFDGVCNLCNSAVKFVIKRDKSSVFKFASLQSEAAQELLKEVTIPVKDLNTFVLYDQGKIYLKSSAALRVSRHLSGFWPLMIGFIIVPPFIRDGVYDFISKKRYRWFGKSDVCMVPDAVDRERFLDAVR